METTMGRLKSACPGFFTAEDIVVAIFRWEDNTEHVNPRHSIEREYPQVISCRVGEAPSSVNGQHIFTDFGIGFGAVQPYNRRTYNIYIPEDNMKASAVYIKDRINDASTYGPLTRIFVGYANYNQGPNNWTPDKPPSQYDGTENSGAKYALGVWGHLGIPLPTSLNQ
jgi:hypothetical protein